MINKKHKGIIISILLIMLVIFLSPINTLAEDKEALDIKFEDIKDKELKSMTNEEYKIFKENYIENEELKNTLMGQVFKIDDDIKSIVKDIEKNSYSIDDDNFISKDALKKFRDTSELLQEKDSPLNIRLSLVVLDDLKGLDMEILTSFILEDLDELENDLKNILIFIDRENNKVSFNVDSRLSKIIDFKSLHLLLPESIIENGNKEEISNSIILVTEKIVDNLKMLSLMTEEDFEDFQKNHILYTLKELIKILIFLFILIYITAKIIIRFIKRIDGGIKKTKNIIEEDKQLKNKLKKKGYNNKKGD